MMSKPKHPPIARRSLESSTSLGLRVRSGHCIVINPRVLNGADVLEARGKTFAGKSVDCLRIATDDSVTTITANSGATTAYSADDLEVVARAIVVHAARKAGIADIPAWLLQGS